MVLGSDWSSNRWRQELWGHIFYHENWEQRNAVRKQRRNNESSPSRSINWRQPFIRFTYEFLSWFPGPSLGSVAIFIPSFYEGSLFLIYHLQFFLSQLKLGITLTGGKKKVLTNSVILFFPYLISTCGRTSMKLLVKGQACRPSHL